MAVKIEMVRGGARIRYRGAEIKAVVRTPRQAELAALLETEEVDAVIDQKLEELQSSPVGPMLKMAGPELIKKVLKDFLGGLLPALAPRLGQAVGGSIDVGGLRAQVDRLLEAKLEELTPDKVKEMMERVIYYSLNPDVKVVSHNYDFCVPSPDGYELFDIFPIDDSAFEDGNHGNFFYGLCYGGHVQLVKKCINFMSNTGSHSSK